MSDTSSTVVLGVDLASGEDFSVLMWADFGGTWEGVPVQRSGVIEHMTQTLGGRKYEVTHVAAIREQHTATPSGLGRVATDGERVNGRLAWVPGA